MISEEALAQFIYKPTQSTENVHTTMKKLAIE